MERIKNMSLKKSLFTLTLINLLLAVILSAAAFWGCTKLSAALDPSGVQIVVGADAIIKTEFPEPTAGTAVAGNVLAVLQFCLPILFGLLDFHRLFFSVDKNSTSGSCDNRNPFPISEKTG